MNRDKISIQYPRKNVRQEIANLSSGCHGHPSQAGRWIYTDNYYIEHSHGHPSQAGRRICTDNYLIETNTKI